MILLYQNLPEGNRFVTATTVIWAALIGLFIGCVLSMYSKLYLGRVVRSLIKKEAVGRDRAVALKDLGIRPSALYRAALREGASLRKHVFIKNPDECALADNSSSFVKKLRRFFTGKEERDRRYDLGAALLYIPEERKHEAEVKYESRANPFIVIPLAAVLFAALAALAYFGMPWLLDMIDSIITTFRTI